MINNNGKCIIGPGVVVDIQVLLKEIEQLEARGKNLDNLFIDERAHIIMQAVELAMDRQEVHGIISDLSMQVAMEVKQQGLPNNLIAYLKAEPRLAVIHNRLEQIFDPSAYTGYASEQVESFYHQDVQPLLDKYAHLLTSATPEINK